MTRSWLRRGLVGLVEDWYDSFTVESRAGRAGRGSFMVEGDVVAVCRGRRLGTPRRGIGVRSSRRCGGGVPWSAIRNTAERDWSELLASCAGGRSVAHASVDVRLVVVSTRVSFL